MESSSEPPEASRFSDINRHKWRQVWKTHFLSLSLFFFLLRKTCQTFNWCSLNAFMWPAKSDLEESAPSIKVPVCNIQGTGHRQCAGPDTAWRGRALLGNAGESLRAFFFFFFFLLLWCADYPRLVPVLPLSHMATRKEGEWESNRPALFILTYKGIKWSRVPAHTVLTETDKCLCWIGASVCLRNALSF